MSSPAAPVEHKKAAAAAAAGDSDCSCGGGGSAGLGAMDAASGLPACVSLENPTCDFTPPQYLTLLFTDLGVLTPSAVSDELIKLYQ